MPTMCRKIIFNHTHHKKIAVLFKGDDNMFGKKLCINLTSKFAVSIYEQPAFAKKAGFDGVFWCTAENDDDLIYKKVCAAGLEVQSLHAPYGGAADMWLDGITEDDNEKTRKAEKQLIDCVHSCVKYGAPVMVAHTFIGFDDVPHIPTDAGFERYGRVIDEAEKNGVKIAFENTEGEEYLAALLKRFVDRKNVGYCWDSGHEMCYNGSRDLLALYGDRLFATHINDNLGVKSPEGIITWHDDLHLPPFDGIADWNYNAERLAKCGFEGSLTFELKTASIPDRHENDEYTEMSAERFFAEAYKRACRVGSLVMRAEKARK